MAAFNLVPHLVKIGSAGSGISGANYLNKLILLGDLRKHFITLDINVSTVRKFKRSFTFSCENPKYI